MYKENTGDRRREMLKAFASASKPSPGLLERSAIKRFQQFHGLVPDGIVGPRTLKKLRETNTKLLPNQGPMGNRRWIGPRDPLQFYFDRYGNIRD
jgi:peptidoglycan hydrolase-like protein with peptidoglycan-binding domain